MNPTDQARKEARKRELKKNKKQRQMVRAAVLKGKDPSQIIMEMEKIDSMEYNVEVPPALSEKVLKDKRKKLRETLDRVLKLYEKENPEYWVEIRRMEGDYEKKRQQLIEYYESVRHAQAVTVDEIPLPNLDMPPMPDDSEMSEMPPPQEVVMPSIIPNAHIMTPHSILKKLSSYTLPPPETLKKPPGCPPTLPPELSDEEDDLEDGVEMENNSLSKTDEALSEDKEKPTKGRTIRFADADDADDQDEEKDTRLTLAKHKGLTSLQTKLLQMSGQDIDDFMKETETLFHMKEAERKADLKARLDKLKDDDDSDDEEDGIKTTSTPTQINVPPPQVRTQGPPQLSSNPQSNTSFPAANNPQGPPGVPTGVPPVGNMGVPALSGVPTGVQPPIGAPGGVPGAPPLMFRPPPPMRGAGMPPPPGVRLPPGLPPQGMPPRLPNMRMPPPMPPRLPMRPPGVPPGMPPLGMLPRMPLQNPNVLSAGPQLIARPREDEKKSSATIEAAPQIRQMSADVTRFLPTALRVKRDAKNKMGKNPTDLKDPSGGKPEEADRKPTKDDAYSAFMREMEGLM